MFKTKPYVAITTTTLAHKSYQTIQPLELYMGLMNLLRVLAIHSVWKQKFGVNYSEVLHQLQIFIGSYPASYKIPPPGVCRRA